MWFFAQQCLVCVNLSGQVGEVPARPAISIFTA